MNVRAMSHTSDPDTSHDAAAKVDPHDTLRLKLAIIELLADSPLTGDELTFVYFQVAGEQRWPRIEDRHNVKRRLSELHKRHAVIRPSGEKRASRMGRASTVWELAISAEEARQIVEAS